MTEAEILEELLHRDRYGGCIIYGEGGIGKTRMMMELGFTAEKQGWIVYKITNKLKSLVSLRDWLYPGSNHLLVFDYIEENPLFAPDIIEQLYDICPEASIKVIGNCRKTYIDISELMESEAFLKVNVSLKDRKRELDYKNYVVGNILGDLRRFFKVDKSFYELRPSFAVFLRFLNEEYKEEEELDFRNEINRHPLLFYELFSQYIDQCQQAYEPLRDLLTKTSLMKEASIVTLLVEKRNFFKESIQSQVFGLRLAFKMKYFSKNDTSANIKDKVKMLLDMWQAANHDFLKYRYISVRVIAEFLKLFGLDDHLGPKGKAVVYAKEWLEKFPLEMETSFVIKSWLDAQGDRELVKKYIKPWLSKFPFEEENTSFVLRSWFNAYGEPEEIASFVVQWLEKFHNSFEASYVIRAWLKNTKDPNYIKTYAHQWLQAFKDHSNADFVIKRFCRHWDIPDDILDAAVHWYKKYENDSEALFTLLYLTRYHINNEKIASSWLLENLSNWTNREKLDQKDLKNLENIMYNISGNKGFCFSEESIELSIKWFLSAHSFQPITLQQDFLQRWWYFERYSRLFKDKLIDIDTNEDKVKKFFNWVNGWLPKYKRRLKPNLKKLHNALPQYNHLWEMVQLD